MLPWFLNHHKQIFDHGVMIDYHSTDRSVEIIKSICPAWEIVTSRNNDFQADNIDTEVMEIEKHRGISVATSVMSFEYKGKIVNILDTPGHKDFAEDTYRTLTAVDSVIMVIDCVKGVETQTEKLMEVCRMRNIQAAFKSPTRCFTSSMAGCNARLCVSGCSVQVKVCP